MHHRPNQRSCSTRRQRAVLVLALIALSLTTAFSPTPVLGRQETVLSSRVSFAVDDGTGPSPADLVERFAPVIADAEIQFGALFAIQPEGVLDVHVVAVPDPVVIDGMRPIGTTAWVSADASVLIVAGDPFLALSDVEAGNILRNALARRYVMQAGGGHVPYALEDGIARYLESPITARQARLGSLVQGRYQAGTLPTSLHLLGGVPNDLTAEESTAANYAFVAFLIDRYGVANLQRLVHGFAGNADWTAVMSSTFDTPLIPLQDAWDVSLPAWFASGWRANVVDAFDLERARQLFNRGAYEAASAEASRSQQLFIDLDDQARLSEAESLLAQCAVGQQADGTMREVEAALREHDYARASSLLDDAEDLYVVLPEAHRSDPLLSTYRSIVDQGLESARRFADAERQGGNLFSLRSARVDALEAGNVAARIGDADAAARADALVAQIDRRIQRYVLLFAALTLVVGSWTAIWIWNRAPGRLQWQRGLRPSLAGRTARVR